MDKICVIGLGYVGLPLAVEFGKKIPTIGLDINKQRIEELKCHIDNTLEVSSELLKEATQLHFVSDIVETKEANIFIVTVPTPVDKNNNPDLTPLEKASAAVATVLKKGDIIIYESTVYPGVTEDVCVPILEKESGLVFNKDFYAGYSPERINPGDKEHTVTKILKVTSGSTPEIAEKVDQLYKTIIVAGTHKAPTIKVAEAAKVIENAQRDINIAFINELSKIFNLLNIDTTDVLEAAGTKWNFLPFKPGLVGGHCIGVDPYYLAQKAQEAGYHPEIILAGRRINDGMGAYVADRLISLMIKEDISIKNSNVLMLGITFKENCPDIRNSKAIDIVNRLAFYGITPHVYDPWANVDEVQHEYKIALITLEKLQATKYDAMILAVSHNAFLKIDLATQMKLKHVVFDVKGVLPKNMITARL
jgi:UDP-N-acetyl-D-glucosamine/UDP-N-acetyl-D-galactosamine dehydrogenase